MGAACIHVFPLHLHPQTSQSPEEMPWMRAEKPGLSVQLRLLVAVSFGACSEPLWASVFSLGGWGEGVFTWRMRGWGEDKLTLLIFAGWTWRRGDCTLVEPRASPQGELPQPRFLSVCVCMYVCRCGVCVWIQSQSSLENLSSSLCTLTIHIAYTWTQVMLGVQIVLTHPSSGCPLMASTPGPRSWQIQASGRRAGGDDIWKNSVLPVAWGSLWETACV